MKQLKIIAPYLSIFGLFVLLSSLIAPTMAVQRGVDTPEWLGRSLAIAGAILVLSWPLFRWEDVRDLLGTRQARYGGNALLLVLSFLAILGVLNFFGTRYFRTWDLTENKQFSISNKTVQILEGLEDVGRPITVTAVLATNSPEQVEFDRLAEQYRRRNESLSFATIDPAIDILAYNALVARTGEQPGNRVLVSESGGNHALVYSSFDEQALTEAIVKATRDDEKRILFSAGHGEYAPDRAEDGRSYSAIKTALEREGYAVETLNTVVDGLDAIEADALVIAGPTTPFRAEEISLLEDYLASGGGVLLLLDPTADVGLGSLLDSWGIGLRSDVILDPARNYGNASVPAVVRDGYKFHTITKDLVGSENASVFVSTSSLQTAEPPPEGLTLTPLLETSADAWGETDLENPQAQRDPEDNPGPLTMGVAVESIEAGSRMVVFGSSSVAADGLLEQLQLNALFGTGLMNGDIVLNSANWLAQDELLIGIEPTAPDDHPINLPQNPLLLLLSTVVLVPLAVAAVGFWIWWGRR